MRRSQKSGADAQANMQREKLEHWVSLQFVILSASSFCTAKALLH
jgi:hypothetical protein